MLLKNNLIRKATMILFLGGFCSSIGSHDSNHIALEDKQFSVNESPCEEVIHLKKLETKKNYLYRASNTITTSEIYEIKEDSKSDITMKAGKMIVLKSHTALLKGNRYLGAIEPCDEIDDCEKIKLKFNSFFTPNGDGHSDYWNIKDIESLPNSIIYVYDRYGKLLEKILPGDIGWDGTYNSKPLPAADYWFKVVYSDCNGNLKEFKSHFSLKK